MSGKLVHSSYSSMIWGIMAKIGNKMANLSSLFDSLYFLLIPPWNNTKSKLSSCWSTFCCRTDMSMSFPRDKIRAALRCLLKDPNHLTILGVFPSLIAMMLFELSNFTNKSPVFRTSRTFADAYNSLSRKTLTRYSF